MTESIDWGDTPARSTAAVPAATDHATRYAEPHMPAWVTELIIALDTYEDRHGDTHTCLADALQGVPAVALDRARAIAEYQVSIGRRTRPLPDHEEIAP